MFAFLTLRRKFTALLRDENGLYYRPSAKDSPAEEQTSPMFLEDLTKLVQYKRGQ
jgi:hypothetical protein